MSKAVDEKLVMADSSVGEDRATWMGRTFSKMRMGSLRGSILSLLVTGIGTGIFTLHHLFDSIGIVPAFGCMLVFGIMYYIITDVLIFCYSKHPDSTSLNDLILKILGRHLGSVFDFVFFTLMLLAVIAKFLSISGAFYHNFQGLIDPHLPDGTPEHKFQTYNFYFCIGTSGFLFLVNLKRSIDEYKYFSFVSVLIFIFIVLVSVFETPIYIDDLKKKGEDDYRIVHLDLNDFLSNIGLLIYSYNCVCNFVGVARGLKASSSERLRKVYRRTYGTMGVIFTVFGLFSYLSLGSTLAEKTDLFIFRPQVGSSDVFMIIGRTLLMFSLFVGMGLLTYPLKVMIYHFSGWRESALTNIFTTLFFTVFVVSIAANFTGVTKYVSIAGAFSCTLIAFTFPGICGIKLGYVKSLPAKILMSIWISLLTTMGMYGSYLEILKF